MRRAVRSIDLVLAAVLLAAGEAAVMAGDPDRPVVLALLTALYTVPLGLRRRWPLPVIAAVITAVALTSLLSDTSQIAIPLALLVAAFTAGRELDPPQTWLGGGGVLLFVWTGLAVEGAPGMEFLGSAVLFGFPWAIGQVLRGRAREAASASARIEQAEQGRKEAERAAVEAERARIARELHDIVSHSLSVVVVQTAAIRRRLEHLDRGDTNDLAAVETTARQALAEMRRLFGVLRAGQQPPLAPQPGLDQLDELIAQSRAAGLDVDLQIRGHRVPLSPGVDLAGFRIIQEALTNVRRHAGSSRATVRLSFAEETLEVLVDDDGPAHVDADASPGHGLAGMRERVALYGGSLDVGRRPEGGFRVRAQVPLREATQR